MLVPGKIQHIICTGNLFIKEVHDYLKTPCPDLHKARGEYDEETCYLETKTLTIGNSNLVYVTGGHRRQLDVDILVMGHPHQFTAYKHEGCVVNNPPGAYSSVASDVNPGFVLMDIDGGLHHIGGEVKLDKIDFKKTTATTTAH